ncbi:MAG: hypothetical protein DCC65_05535 [Planctomycetota bacterium]|nr:MAG: hypothetical protein DCC65_05535 [Planctomycetota bacterium]
MAPSRKKQPETPRFQLARFIQDAVILAAALQAFLAASVLGSEVGELEPNDSIQAASLLRNRESVRAEISPAGELDTYRVPHCQAGDLIFAWVDSRVSPPDADGNKPDSLLQVLNSDGRVLESDDNDGPKLGSVVAGAETDAPGDVFYRVMDPSIPHVLDAYELHHAVVSPADAVSETEPNDTIDQADFITSRLTTGTTHRAEFDFYRVDVRAGERLVVLLDADPERNGLVTPIIVTIFSADGTPLASGDALSVANPDTNSAHAAGTVVAETDGPLFILVRGIVDDHETTYRFVALVNDRVFSDTDADGIEDIRDNCPFRAGADQTDRDGDRTGDLCDLCPDSPLKSEPGECGCDKPDVDIDGDGRIDCDSENPARALLERSGILLATGDLSGTVAAYDARDGRFLDPLFIEGRLVGGHGAFLTFDGARRRVLSLIGGNRILQISLDTLESGEFALGINAGGANFINASCLAVLPDGHVLVPSNPGPGGTPEIVELDAEGGFVGRRIPSVAPAISAIANILVRGDEILVSDSGLNAVHRFDLRTGAHLGPLGQIQNHFIGMAGASNGNILIASTAGSHRGIMELVPGGDLVGHYTPADLSFFRAVFELANGRLAVTASRGVSVIDRDGLLISDENRRFLSSYLAFAQFDRDADGIGDAADNAPEVFNPDQADDDGDGIANAVDPKPPDAGQSLGLQSAPCGVCGPGVTPAMVMGVAGMWTLGRRRRGDARR